MQLYKINLAVRRKRRGLTELLQDNKTHRSRLHGCALVQPGRLSPARHALPRLDLASAREESQSSLRSGQERSAQTCSNPPLPRRTSARGTKRQGLPAAGSSPLFEPRRSPGGRATSPPPGGLALQHQKKKVTQRERQWCRHTPGLCLRKQPSSRFLASQSAVAAVCNSPATIDVGCSSQK